MHFCWCECLMHWLLFLLPVAHLEITIAASTAASIAAIIVATPTKQEVVTTATAADRLLRAVEDQVRLAVCTRARVFGIAGWFLLTSQL